MNERMSDDPDPAHTRVLISNRVGVFVDEARLVELARRTLKGEGLHDVELSVSLVGEEEIAGLHERYTGEPDPTDVLSFPMGPGDVDETGTRVLGDVVIAPAVAARNNESDPQAEIRLLLVHGILHLLGYDHERKEDRIEMWERQERYSGVRVS